MMLAAMSAILSLIRSASSKDADTFSHSAVGIVSWSEPALLASAVGPLSSVGTIAVGTCRAGRVEPGRSEVDAARAAPRARKVRQSCASRPALGHAALAGMTARPPRGAARAPRRGRPAARRVNPGTTAPCASAIASRAAIPHPRSTLRPPTPAARGIRTSPSYRRPSLRVFAARGRARLPLRPRARAPSPRLDLPGCSRTIRTAGLRPRDRHEPEPRAANGPPPRRVVTSWLSATFPEISSGSVVLARSRRATPTAQRLQIGVTSRNSRD